MAPTNITPKTTSNILSLSFIFGRTRWGRTNTEGVKVPCLTVWLQSYTRQFRLNVCIHLAYFENKSVHLTLYKEPDIVLSIICLFTACEKEYTYQPDHFYTALSVSGNGIVISVLYTHILSLITLTAQL